VTDQKKKIQPGNLRGALKDRQLWETVTRTVTPITTQKEGFASLLKGTKLEGVKPLPQPEKLIPMNRTYGRGPAPKVAKPVPTREMQTGRVTDVDTATVDRLKKGRMTVDAKLDLHGMNQSQAHSALSSFVNRAYDRGHRCVLVITGKGIWRKEGGVLREQVPRWLNMPEMKSRVLGFSFATQRDGGSGALYVLVKRRRTHSADGERSRR
jgi:DNA-nicking Smr family endonuclease